MLYRNYRYSELIELLVREKSLSYPCHFIVRRASLSPCVPGLRDALWILCLNARRIRISEITSLEFGEIGWIPIFHDHCEQYAFAEIQEQLASRPEELYHNEAIEYFPEFLKVDRSIKGYSLSVSDN